MLKLQFTNAVVKDAGYGLEVNGRDLSEIISIALGTRVDNAYGYGSGLPDFRSNCCDITVTIDPKPSTVSIQTEKNKWTSVETMERVKRGELEKKDAKTEPEA